MNPVIAGLTLRQLLSGRRVLLIAVLPLVLVALSVVVRLLAGAGTAEAVSVLDGLGLGVVVPLLGLIVGVGVLGSEIDDGSIVYLLTKPLSRYELAATKAAVAGSVAVVATAVPTAVAGLVMGLDRQLTAGFALSAAVAGLAYACLTAVLTTLTRAAVAVGLVYVLVWEGVVGGFVPGARAVSVRQWAAAVAEGALGSRAQEVQLTSAVDPWTGLILIVVVVVGATVLAGRRLDRMNPAAG